MNLKDFYTIISHNRSENGVQYAIRLNPLHPLYKGHFPDQPVVPGIMQIELIADLLSQEYQQAYQLKKASNIKYLNVVVPSEEPLQVDIKINSLEEENLKVNAVIKAEANIYTKCSGVFSKKSS